jgi:hypothetical protein
MTSTNFAGQAGTMERGHNYVTGTATLRPGTFHEPDQPRPMSSGGLSDQVEAAMSSAADTVMDVLGSTRDCMKRYPVAVFFTGIALGAVLTWMCMGSRS